MFQQICFSAVPISNFCGGGQNAQATATNRLVSAIRQIYRQASSLESLRQEDGLCFES